MKSSIKIISHGHQLGVIETREFHFFTKSVIDVLNVLVDSIKEFSADRTKRRVTITITLE